MTIPEKAVDWALEIARDDSHGYDQANRWGADYDCSSLVISAYEAAGVPVRRNGATYTGNMRSAFKRCGFREVEDHTLKAGDVLLNEAKHTALYIGGGQLVQASLNELGTVTGGATGDQTGSEISVRSYYSYPWDCVLRYEGDTEIIDGTECGVTLPELCRGDRGSAVLSMQILLIHKWAVSCGSDGADGDFGPNTKKAVESFQSHYGLDPDGIVGERTWKKLLT